MTSTFEAPIHNGSLDNPNLTDKENRRLDKLMEIETPEEAWRRAAVKSENPEYVDPHDAEIKAAAQRVMAEKASALDLIAERVPEGLSHEERIAHEDELDRRLRAAKKSEIEEDTSEADSPVIGSRS